MTTFIVREFRLRTGLRVRVVSGGTGDLLRQLEEERDAPSADVMWGGGAESLEAKKYLFQPYVPSDAEHLYPQYTEPGSLWTGFSVMPMVIMYNPQLVPEDMVPDSWMKICSPYFDGRLAMADPARSGSSFSILMTILGTFPDEEAGWGYAEKLLGVLGPKGVAAPSSDVYRQVSAGERFAGLTFENAVRSIRAAGTPAGLAYPREGTSAVPDGIALIRGAAHPDAAAVFIDFALSRDVQNMVRTRWMRRSVRTDVEPPEGTPPLDTIRLLPYSITEAAGRQDEVLARWEKTVETVRKNTEEQSVPLTNLL